MKKVVAHGTFDIFHYGHINYLEKAKSYGDYLIVLVSSDDVAKSHGKSLYFNESNRLKLISSLKIVNEAILRTNKITKEFLESLDADTLVTTDPKLEEILKDDVKVVVLPRTEGISSTMIREYLKKEEN